MSEEDKKTSLGHKIERKRIGELTGFFSKSQKESQLTRPVSFKAKTLEETPNERIMDAVAGYLSLVSPKVIEQFESSHPLTASALFKISNDMIQGAYGARLQQEAISCSDFILNFEKTIKLLLFHSVKESDEKEFPEVLQPIKDESSFLRSECSPIEPIQFEKILVKDYKELLKEEKACRESLDRCMVSLMMKELQITMKELEITVKVFKKYLYNLANPSSAAIKMMVEKKDSIDHSVKAALDIKNQSERVKSIGHIIGNLVDTNHVSSAIKVIGSIKTKKEVSLPLQRLVKHLLHPKRKDIEELIQGDQIDEAIAIADSMTEKTERDNIYQRMVSGLARHKEVDKALEIANKISDNEMRDFSMSSLVNGLIASHDFENAIKVAKMISEMGYREDADSYIVRGLLDSSFYERSIAFVAGISDPVERLHAAKVILSWARSHQDQQKIEELVTRFQISA